MKSSNESASKSSLGLLILSSEKKLYWRPDGSNNRTEWMENFTHVFRGVYPTYAKFVQTGTVPEAWKAPYVIPNEVGALNPLQVEMEKQKMQDCRNWENVRPAICTFILQNISESSLKRAKTQHHAEWDDALDNSDPELVYKMLVDSHNFHGKAASTEEIDQTPVSYTHLTLPTIYSV